MQQLASVWSSLTVQRRFIVVLATVAMFAAVLMLSRAATAPSMTLLYSGLEPGAAGDVVTSLEQRGVVYDVRGGAIYVDSAQRDELRMTLAAEGLPANGGAGYELLDSLSGFGTTSQMFDAAYWRAKEGELARTIASSQNIRSARVHIASATNQGFRRDLKPSASVALVPAGQGLSPQQARAVRFLVASAVTGLRPEDVSVIDGESGLVLGGDDAGAVPQGDPDRAVQLKRNVERLLEAHVGAGRAIVELSIETATDREQITERRFDPETRVAISTETEERTGRSDDSRPGSVSVASNLPAGDAAAGGDGRSSSQNSETRERVNYEVSETQREILRGPGAVKRITVAVLVDGQRGTDAAGAETFTPRSEEELASLRELVESAVGFNAERGDVITLKSMPFEAIAIAGTEASSSVLAGINVVSIVQLAVFAIVALILGLFVIRPILAPKLLAATGAAPRQLAGLGGSIDRALPSGSSGGGQVFNGEIDDGDDFFGGGFPSVNTSLPALRGESDPGGEPGSDSPAFDPNDPVARLRRLIAERQDETVEILRSWMDEREEKV